MKDYRWLLFGLLLLLGSVAHAEGNCPPGYYPIGAPPGQGGPQGCAPIPGDNNTQQQAQPQQPPPQLWVDHWGAMVSDDSLGKLGVAVDRQDEAGAWQTAEEDCHAKGGLNCTRLISYRNQCIALVAGEKTYSFSAALTAIDAIQQATKKCTASTTNCHVYYSACSMPVRVQ